MLLLRMGEVEAQIGTNAVEIEENQGLPSGHSRGEEPRLALGRAICTGARQTELGPHYRVAASLALLRVSSRRLLALTFISIELQNFFPKHTVIKIRCALYKTVFVVLCIYVSVFLYLYVMSVYIDRGGKKRKYMRYG